MMTMEAYVQKSLQEELGNKTSLISKPKRIRKLRPGNCEYCNKWFADRRHLYAHVRIHTGEKPFVCHVCNRAFNQSSNLRRHLELHLERKPLVCKVCGRQLIDRLHFNEHVRSHSGERPYCCDICNKRFSFKGSLSRHKASHDQETNFSCTICNKEFSRHFILKEHMRIHNKETKSYPCTLCKKVFSRSYPFQRHLTNTHNIKIAYQCKVCNERFRNKATLKGHYLSHKNDNSDAPHTKFKAESEQVQNSESDTTKNALLTEFSSASQEEPVDNSETGDFNITKNRYFCGICYEEFDSSTSIQEHLSTHKKEVVFVCHKCKNCFASTGLLETHACPVSNNMKLLECCICEEQFFSKNDLKEHLFSHTKDDYF